MARREAVNWFREAKADLERARRALEVAEEVIRIAGSMFEEST